MKKLIFLLIFGLLFLIPVRPAGAQILTFDPVTAGIQSVIQAITTANTEIQAAESHIEVELSALKYVRQGQQLMNQVQNMQSEAGALMGAVNNLQTTITLPASEAAGLFSQYQNNAAGMQNIIAQEQGNPMMANFLQNFRNTYGYTTQIPTGTLNNIYASSGGYTDIQSQATQGAGYAQNVLDNAPNNNNMVTQLSSNIKSANGTVSALQANGQAEVYTAKEIATLNKLMAMQLKLNSQAQAQEAAMNKSAIQTVAQQANSSATVPTTTVPALSGSSPFGVYPAASGFNIGK